MPTIAVLSNNAALCAVLASTLRRERGWRVREFSNRAALRAYMRLAPVAILVGDYDLGGTTTAELASEIRSDGTLMGQDLQIITLTRTMGSDVRRRCIEAGIDEVIVKPMSPLYLEERVRARLDTGPLDYVRSLPHYNGPERRDRIALPDPRPEPVDRRMDNVISLVAHRATREQTGFRPDA